MQDWFSIIGSGCELPPSALQELREVGFVIIPGPVGPDGLAQLSAAYDLAFASTDQVRLGSTTNRVNDLVDRGSEFDELYVHQPVLEACLRVIGGPFKLSTMLARTVRPQVPAQSLHVDFGRDSEGFPMIGFIFMVDEFRSDNGATRFVRGSHNWPTVSEAEMNDHPLAGCENQIAACGPAGSVIVYNGSAWHGHTANSSGEPRRSIQGAFIRRSAESSGNLPARMHPDTLARISPLAKYLLSI